MYIAKVRIAPLRATRLILERRYAADFRTHTLGDSFRTLSASCFQIRYNHVMAILQGWRVRILLLAEFKRRQSMGWFLAAFRSSQREPADFTCGLEVHWWFAPVTLAPNRRDARRGAINTDGLACRKWSPRSAPMPNGLRAILK